MPSLRKLKAIANLGNHFWLHLLRRAVARPKPGAEKAKFIEYYRDDKIVGLDADERALLLNCQNCINCGTCASVCPVYGPATHGLYRAPDSITASLSRSFPEFGAAHDSVHNCTQCGACAPRCPMGIDIPALVMMVRRKSVQSDGALLRAMYSEHLGLLEKTGNVHGGSAEFGEYKKEKAEYVYFTGCAGSAFASADTAKTLELLKLLGVDFTVVDNTCCGGFHRSAGILGPDTRVVKTTIEKIRDAGTTKVITSCPHGLFTMRTHPEYKMNIQVEHVTQFLARSEFDLNFERSREPVTYHDPCFLGRRSGVFDEPRELIVRAGAKLIEMPRRRERSACCGAREGEFILDEQVSRAMAEDRLTEAKATGAAVLLTACPSCAKAFSNGANAAIKVMSINEYILNKLKK